MKTEGEKSNHFYDCSQRPRIIVTEHERKIQMVFWEIAKLLFCLKPKWQTLNEIANVIAGSYSEKTKNFRKVHGQYYNHTAVCCLSAWCRSICTLPQHVDFMDWMYLHRCVFARGHGGSWHQLYTITNISNNNFVDWEGEVPVKKSHNEFAKIYNV